MRAAVWGHTSWEVVDFSIIFQVHPCFAEFYLTDEASVGIELSGKRSRGDIGFFLRGGVWEGMRITLHYWWYSTCKLPSRAVMILTVKIYFRPIRPFFFLLFFLSLFRSFDLWWCLKAADAAGWWILACSSNNKKLSIWMVLLRISSHHEAMTW